MATDIVTILRIGSPWTDCNVEVFEDNSAFYSCEGKTVGFPPLDDALENAHAHVRSHFRCLSCGIDHDPELTCHEFVESERA